MRCREVRGKTVDSDTLRLDDLIYQAGTAEEHFISFVTPDDGLAGFVRLSLPAKDALLTGMPDLDNAALIREVHVYGQSLAVGAEKTGAAQHTGTWHTPARRSGKRGTRAWLFAHGGHLGNWNTSLLFGSRL